MRLFVLFLAFLAGAKVWTQDTLFRAGAEEALINAYLERAMHACQQVPRTKDGSTPRNPDWARPASIRMSTGSRNVGVYFWQVDDAAWSARYRNPYLVLASDEGPSASSCEYDVLSGQAIVRL